MWNNSEIKIVIYKQIVFYIGSQLDTFIAIFQKNTQKNML